MLFINGDSHVAWGLKNLSIPNNNLGQQSITMHRCGRDNRIYNFSSDIHDENSILLFSHGEIDCRCHIQKQIDKGRNEDEIITSLVTNYFSAILNNVGKYYKIIVVPVIFTTNMYEFEKRKLNNSNHPFVGTDYDRVRFTSKINNLIIEQCKINNFIVFDPYDKEIYEDEIGCLKYELSDGHVHIKDYSYLLDKFMILHEKIMSEKNNSQTYP